MSLLLVLVLLRSRLTGFHQKFAKLCMKKESHVRWLYTRTRTVCNEYVGHLWSFVFNEFG